MPPQIYCFYSDNTVVLQKAHGTNSCIIHIKKQQTADYQLNRNKNMCGKKVKRIITTEIADILHFNSSYLNLIWCAKIHKC